MMDERQGQMKIRWEQAWQKQSANVDEYNRVGVLLIRWSNELDDLETEKECRELERIFKEQFNYATELLELQAKPTPHIQVSLHHMRSSLQTSSNQTDEKAVKTD